MRRVLVLLLALGCSSDAPRAAPTTAPPTPSVSPSSLSPSPTPRVTTPAPTPTRVEYVFPIAGCRATYGRAHHDYPATDLFAARGCDYVSPVDGRVDEVTYTDDWSAGSNRGADRGGLSVSVVGIDGVRYYGSHLAAVAPGIRPGVRVTAGTRLGDVGTTGSARGTPPHLHFGISWPTRPRVWWVRRGVVHPWRYLDSWRAGGDLSPRVEVERERRATGADVPPCPSYC